jgi:hypothetical protein
MNNTINPKKNKDKKKKKNKKDKKDKKDKNDQFSTKNILEISIDLSNPKEFEKNILDLKKKLQFLKNNE